MKTDDNIILRTVALFLFYLINLFSFFLLLRGHNQPGGGFVGGLGCALSVLLLCFALGVETAQRVVKVDPLRIATTGLIVAFLTATGPVLFGQPFLSHYHIKLSRVPLVGELPLGTPLLFDLGVFLVVIGITAKLIFVLMRSLSGLTALEDYEHRRYAAPLERPIEEEGRRTEAHPKEEGGGSP